MGSIIWININNINKRALPFKWKSCIILEIQINVALGLVMSLIVYTFPPKCLILV